MSKRKFVVKLPSNSLHPVKKEEYSRKVLQTVKDFMPEADWLVLPEEVDIWDLTDYGNLDEPVEQKKESETTNHYYLRNQIIERIKSRLYGVHPISGKPSHTPYNHQITIMDKINNSDKNFFAVMTGRQMGLSMITKNYAAMAALLDPESNILFTSNTLNSVYASRDDIHFILKELLSDLTDDKVEIVTNNKSEISLSNGSRMFFTTLNENTGRGLSLDYVFVDNASYSRTDIEDWWASIYPALPKHSTVILTSTANSGQQEFNKIVIGHPRYVNTWEGIYMSYAMACEIDDGQWKGEERLKDLRTYYSKDTFESSFNLNNKAHCFNEFE